MLSKYSMTWDATDRLITVKPIGFWSADDFSSYERDIIAMLDRIGPFPFDFITDMSDRVPQSAEVSALFKGLAAKMGTMGLRRLVIVGATPLLRMQAKRVTAVATPHFATSTDEAIEWLRSAKCDGST